MHTLSGYSCLLDLSPGCPNYVINSEGHPQSFPRAFSDAESLHLNCFTLHQLKGPESQFLFPLLRSSGLKSEIGFIFLQLRK